MNFLEKVKDFKELDNLAKWHYKEDWLKPVHEAGCTYISEWLYKMRYTKRTELAKMAKVTAQTITRRYKRFGIPTPPKVALRARLSPSDVLYIRKKCKESGVRQVDLAKEMGVPPSVISNIKHRVTWKHVK